MDLKSKHCPRCCLTKPQSEWHLNQNRKDGFDTYCKQCKHEFYILNTPGIRRREQKYERHGMHLTSTYQCWGSMKARCDDKNRHNYKYYGGRGISYTPSWAKFSVFLADMGKKPQGLSIERINNDGNYCKENCVWATRAQQNRNKRQQKAGKELPKC